MSAELKLQDRMQVETKEAYQAYLDYRDMGGSIAALHDSYVRRKSDGKSSAKIPTTRKRTLETWSSAFQWQKRIEEWQKYENEQRLVAADKAREDERGRRKNLLDKWFTKIDKQMRHADLSTEEGIKAYRAIMDGLNKYFEQSRKEHNDMPTERRDITSGGKPIIEWIEPLDDEDDTGIGADELPASD